MDFCRNVSVAAGEYHQPEQTHLDDLFSTHTTEVDVSLEWLSIFVEDCLTSTGNCLPPPPTTTNVQANPTLTDPQPTNISKALHLLQKKPQQKARSKRRKKSTKPRSHFMSWTNPISQNIHHMAMASPDPLLLQQDHWLADSELIILPQKDEQEHDLGDGEGREKGGGQGRRCSHCLSQRTPQWRAGPLGPKTLCNACGVRFKSGRLLPEYRPAKSPTFVTNLHSNSHKKVLEMRNIMPHSG